MATSYLGGRGRLSGWLQSYLPFVCAAAWVDARGGLCCRARLSCAASWVVTASGFLRSLHAWAIVVKRGLKMEMGHWSLQVFIFTYDICKLINLNLILVFLILVFLEEEMDQAIPMKHILHNSNPSNECFLYISSSLISQILEGCQRGQQYLKVHLMT